MIFANLSLSDLPIDLWAINGILAFSFSVLLTGILIPQILLISFRKKLFDVPDERKIHQGTVPRLGGIAFMPAIILSLSVIMGMNIMEFGDSADHSSIFIIGDDALEICFGLCALMMLYLVGMADDLIGVKYRAKFVVQIIAAILIVSSGMSIDNLHGFLGIYELPMFLAAPFTVVVIVLVVNAVNLIDGIDGLASGLSAIALAFYALVCFSSREYTYAMISLAALGTLVPFFYYNVFGNAKVGKKIFMGDTGALTTGLILSFVAIKIFRIDASDMLAGANSAVLAFAPLVVVCLDVVRVFFHRISRGHSPFEPGRTHIHHKLLALGMPQRRAMILILGISLTYIVVDVMMSSVMSVDIILFADFITWVFGNLLLTRAIRRRQQKMPETRNMYD